MTAREFVAWQVYDAQEGLPDRRAEWSAAMIASVIANVNRRKGARPFAPSDFLARPAARSKRRGDAPARVRTFFDFLAARAGASG